LYSFKPSTCFDTTFHSLTILSVAVSVESILTDASLKSQLRKANKLGGDFALIIGDDEITSGNFIWKDLNEGTQEIVTLEQLTGKITQL